MKDEAMTSAVDGLKQRFMDMSQPDDDGVYRNGATKRKARTELAMQCLTELWNAACKDVSFPVPDSGIGFAAVGSLARGQLGPSSDLDLVIIYEPRTLNDQQLNELANKLWYPLWDSGLDLDHSIRTRAQCEEVTDHDLPAAMGWLDVKPIAGDTALITTTATSILERWRKPASACPNCSTPPKPDSTNSVGSNTSISPTSKRPVGGCAIRCSSPRSPPHGWPTARTAFTTKLWNVCSTYATASIWWPARIPT